MKLFRIFLTLMASVLVVGAVAACSDDDDDDDGDAPAATTAPAAATAPAATTDGDNAGTVTVEGKDFSFDPTAFTVTAGEDVSVVLENTGNAPHTLTVYSDEGFESAVDGADTETISGGDSGEFTSTFDAGEYYFRCEVHPVQMTGTFEAE